MSNYYLDTSALVKRYIDETGSAWLRALVDPALSPMLVEYKIIPLNESIIDLACEMLERHPLRAYDAIHLGTALAINRLLVADRMSALTFLCADKRLLSAATAEGLAVDNPNHHP